MLHSVLISFQGSASSSQEAIKTNRRCAISERDRAIRFQPSRCPPNGPFGGPYGADGGRGALLVAGAIDGRRLI